MKPNPDQSARWPVACILLLAAVLMSCMSSCSGGGQIKTPKVRVTPPVSLLGQLQVASYKAEVRPDGSATVEMTGLATRNPDPELTKAASRAITTIQAARVATNLVNQTAATTRTIDNNAVRINDSNNALQAKKVTAPLEAQTQQAAIAVEAAQQ